MMLGLTILVFTFVMCIGTVIKAIDLVSRGVSLWVIVQVFAVNIPFILSFTIPMSSMTAVLLLFSRLSLDGEITAMRASGLTMWQIVSAPVMISILLSVFCVYLNSYAAPNSHFANRKIMRNAGLEEPVNLLEEGRFVRDFPGFIVYVGAKNENKIRDIVVYERATDGTMRNVRADRGEINSDISNRVLKIDLYDVLIDQPSKDDPMDISKTRQITASKYPVRLDFSMLWSDENIKKTVPSMTMTELVTAIRNVRKAFPDLDEKDLLIQKMKLVVSANERLALALSCFAFTVFGIPLGMRSKRKESSIGVMVSLLVVFLFYLFIIIADSLVQYPELHPDMIIWIPVVTAEVTGFLLIRRMN
jgi:lipopolysaccharide export system permease protein